MTDLQCAAKVGGAKPVSPETLMLRGTESPRMPKDNPTSLGKGSSTVAFGTTSINSNIHKNKASNY
jgi:hypothetical protein